MQHYCYFPVFCKFDLYYVKKKKIYYRQFFSLSQVLFRIISFYNDWLLVGCRLKANCRLVGPEPMGDVPSVGVFLRDPSAYLREFRRKPRKTPNS